MTFYHKSIVEFDELRSLAFGSIGATHTNVGAESDHPIALFCLTNTCNTDMIFSHTGGLKDQLIVPAGSFKLIDVRSNLNVNKQDNCVLPIGTQFTVRYVSAPSEGNIYIEIMHDVPQN